MANTQTQTTTIPSYISDPTKSALSSIQTWLKSPGNYVYGTKPGESLYTDLAPDQKKAIGNVDWLSNQNLSKLLGFDTAGSLYKQGADFKPGNLTDESGYLGPISSEINPYLQQVLDPQIREMNNAYERSTRDLAGSEAMSGSFGDARHGIAEAQLGEANQRNIGDVTGKTYADAWNTAMGIRASDREAATGANQNKFTAAGGIAGLGQNYLEDFLKTNDALFNAGGVTRDANEQRRKAVQDFQTALSSKDYTSALKLLQAITGSGTVPTTTTNTQKSSDGLWGILGSVLGAAL